MPIKVFAEPGHGREEFVVVEQQVNEWEKESQVKIIDVHCTVNDIPAFVDACESNQRPYCAWILDFRDYPALLVDNDPNGYGAGKKLQWTPTGQAYVNYVRQKRGLGNPVDVYGNPSS